ncbi:AsmA-like C-terminal region-containing protein [Myroides sp. DF42-4-2]|uniref:AsmA-like C-terminal region-containing protein n=1 Tax=unclassified Myroides TaxID=2642485 RepID=UPI0025768746|nr:AsmA-like C-terminal region-containing protein [Myroides sp. DF42-4-2]MDM1406510.1 AsmA-like C-terminal region-containing protein [Myroides sp. DF42-4-2]
MKKKIWLWIGGIVGGIFLLLLAAPFLFKGKVQDLVLKTINDNLTATVSFDQVNLSLLKNFPKATVTIDGLTIVNTAPFDGDTLVHAQTIGLKMSVMELFNGEKEPMNIEEILLKEAKINVLVNEEGIANYDIALKDEDEKEEEKDKEDTPFSLALKHYQIENTKLVYTDLSSKMQVIIEEFNHEGKGNLTANVLDLDTQSKAKVSFVMDGTSYLNQVQLALNAMIGMDMDQQIYTFKENKALINQLPLKFDGQVQLLENGQAFDLSFATPDSDFKNFLGLIPEAYAGGLKGVTTTGEFKVAGKVKGNLTETTIPTLAIEMAANNASFKYPDLPKSVEKIVLDMKINNTTGLMKDTYVDLNKLSFKIDQDVFNASANIKNLTENPLVDAKLNGVINLANVTKAYPVKLDVPLTGILKANVTTNFDMNSVEKSQYQNIKNAGDISLTNFHFASVAMAKPLDIKEAAISFNTNHVSLNKFALATGQTDIAADGRLDNLYGFLFNKQTLKGNFNVRSTNFILADLLKEDIAQAAEKPKEEKAKPTPQGEALKIPAFLDCTINADAKTVVYDNLTLKNVKGRLIVKDETARLENMTTDIFGGKLLFAGDVSTKGTQPKFNMDLGLKTLDIKDTFTQFEFLKKIAPIAGIIAGNINANVKLDGQLESNDFSPILNTLSGDLTGDILNSQVNVAHSKLLSSLDSAVKFVDLSKLDLNNKRIHLKFKDGKVQVSPFDLKLKDMNVQVSGEHGFDQQMNYDLDFNVPAKMLGPDVANLLAKLSPQESAKYDAIPVKVGLTGDFSAPKVGTNMNEVITNLTKQIAEDQANKYIDKGKDALKDLLSGGKKDKTEGEQGGEGEKKKTETEEAVDKIGKGLKDLFGKKKSE